MKLILATLLLAACASAATSPRSGDLVTITNASGQVWANVKLVNTLPDGLVVQFTNEMRFEKIPLASLKVEDRARFQRLADEARLREERARAAQAREMADAQARAARKHEFETRKRAFFAGARRVKGEVFQVKDGEALVMSGPSQDAQDVYIISDRKLEHGQKVDLMGYSPVSMDYTSAVGAKVTAYKVATVVPPEFK